MENLRELKVNSMITSIRRVRVKSKRKVKINFETLKYNMMFINVIFSVVLFFTLIAGYSEMVHISSNNLVMQSKLDALEVDQNSLKNIAAPLQNKKRIEAIAKSRLDMIYPNKDNIVKVDSMGSDKKLVLSDFDLKRKSNSNTNSILSIITNIFR